MWYWIGLCFLAVHVVLGNNILELANNPLENVRNAPLQNIIRLLANNILKGKKTRFDQLKKTLKFRPAITDKISYPYLYGFDLPISSKSDISPSGLDAFKPFDSSTIGFDSPAIGSLRADELSSLSLDSPKAEDFNLPSLGSTRSSDSLSLTSPVYQSIQYRAPQQQDDTQDSDQYLLLLLQDFMNPDPGINLREGKRYQLASDLGPKYIRELSEWDNTEGGDSESSESTDDGNAEKEALTLRDRYENACKKSSMRKCYNACKCAVKQACSSYDCGKRFKKRMMNAIKRECKEGFGGVNRAQSSSSESD